MMKTLALVLALAGCRTQSARIGIAECDAYQDKMAACAVKVGGSVGVQLDKMRRLMADAWKTDVTDQELPHVCTSAIGDMQRQLPQCAW